MPHPSTFRIANLRCGYHADREVLRVGRLTIPAAELVFIVGASGGGKSTLLETLGLMNQTTRHTTGGRIDYAEADGTRHSLLDLWEGSDEELSRFRQRHFSFIFQQTNLMGNFSAGDNMLLPALLAGRPASAGRSEVLRLMKTLGLPATVYDTPVTQLSGGQRQRLAFIRALVADYNVLFGDEPTGNLDAATARICLDVLKRETAGRGKTAVIVTHNLDLAVGFGDRIVPITFQSTPGGNVRGTVDERYQLFRAASGNWVDTTGHELAEPATRLETHLLQPTL